MKKILIALFLILALSVALIGCDNETETQTPDNGETETPDSGENETPDNGGNSDTDGSEEDNTPTKYTITWVDEKGNTIASSEVEEGKKPAYSYTVSDTAEWNYTFIGWSMTADGEALSEIPSATQNATYYAKVSAQKQKYTVSFNTMGGSAIPSQTVEYGSLATTPEVPSLEGHRFTGWSTTASGSVAFDFEEEITGNIELFAIWNEVTDIKGMLSALLGGYMLNPFDYIPDTMLYDYERNLVDADDIITDYTTFVNTSDITYGFGEQWHMVLSNLQQSQTFFTVLNTVDSIASASIIAFNNYFDKNPADTARYEFESGIYNVTIDFDGEILYYVLDYTAEIPVLGNQTVQIALAMIADSGEKIVRIQIGDANALTYKLFENSYEFAIKYLGVRRALFTVSKNSDGSVAGHIYEYLGVGAAQISSAADFYITDNYVSVVGNKADGMLGFTGTISELYDANSGKMIGYEIEETLSSIVYNTLWFNLNDVTGINSIKYRAENGDTEEAFFINGKSTEWETKNVGGFSSKLLSRRFDIEFRTQYVYVYDEENEAYVEYEISVPMFFVQEEVYDDLEDDVKDKNGVNVSIAITNSKLNKLLADYDTLLKIFKENKENVTADSIVDYIGSKIEFE